ncbi:Oligo-1,6-glucosidase [Vibrio mediterranei]|uniref:glycoside hydrolase family 13 protein n=1 Tax=Vibrio mediterranei TaxID=689 RepID=UPI0007830A4A|nr:alpha-glucosidase [Vibrio mediterranei]MCG9623705.1 alpha-glucosidase [Vibrio mediterranei]SBO08523.1 Oligo-1,6-glucosidase [Vibrio mediterranei]
MEKRWWHNSVVYQIYPRSFCDSNGDGIGDLNGIRSKLDYLTELGVDVIWLSPVYQSPMDDNGYDISDYQAIAPEFGTMEDMDALLAEAKERGIKIVMDLVVNHTSDEHEWFKRACESKTSPYRDYYVWRDAKPDGSAPSDMGSIFGGSAWEWHEPTQQYYLHLFSKKQPDLNWENPKVHDEVHKMMNWWIDRGIGGFRLDVIDLIGKEIDNGITGNGPRLHPLLKQMNNATFGDKDLLTVGETWDATPEIAKLYSAEDREELSMVFQFEHITLTWTNGDKWKPAPLDLKAFKQVLTKWQLELKETGWNSLFWNNHDLPRAVSKYGNDGQYRVKSAKMLATVLHCLKGTPYIYQGEEIGMTNVKFDNLEQYKDIETLNFYKVRTEAGVSHEEMMAALAENSRDNARTPMQWSNEANAGFSTAEPWIEVNPNYTAVNAELDRASNESIYEYYKALIGLRREFEAVIYGDFIPLLEEHDKVFAYLRQHGEQTLLVVANFSDESVDVDLGIEAPTQCTELLSNASIDFSDFSCLNLEPYDAAVLRL